MLRPTLLAFALSFAWPIIQAAPLPAKSVQHVEQLMTEQQLHDAAQSIQKLLEKDPSNARMYYYLAQIHAANGSWSDADAMLKKAKYFDWRLKFASSKQRIADLENLIDAHKKDFYSGGKDTPAYAEWKRSEKRSYDAALPVEKVTPPFLMAIPAPREVIQIETPRQRTFLWLFAATLGLISIILIGMVRRFNIQNTHRSMRLAEAAIKEQKIVLSDLTRVLNDIEAIAKSENLINLYGQIKMLLDRVHALMIKLEENELQNVGDIEKYVRNTQQYRSHCYDCQDLPVAALT